MPRCRCEKVSGRGSQGQWCLLTKTVEESKANRSLDLFVFSSPPHALLTPRHSPRTHAVMSCWRVWVVHVPRDRAGRHLSGQEEGTVRFREARRLPTTTTVLVSDPLLTKPRQCVDTYLAVLVKLRQIKRVRLHCAHYFVGATGKASTLWPLFLPQRHLLVPRLLRSVLTTFHHEIYRKSRWRSRRVFVGRRPRHRRR